MTVFTDSKSAEPATSGKPSSNGSAPPRQSGRPQGASDIREVDVRQIGVSQVDDDIEECARIQLQLSPYRAIRDVNCRFVGRTLRLTGHLPTFHYKQLAQVAVAGINGVDNIINEITVG